MPSSSHRAFKAINTFHKIFSNLLKNRKSALNTEPIEDCNVALKDDVPLPAAQLYTNIQKATQASRERKVSSYRVLSRDLNRPWPGMPICPKREDEDIYFATDCQLQRRPRVNRIGYEEARTPIRVLNFQRHAISSSSISSSSFVSSCSSCSLTTSMPPNQPSKHIFYIL
ncbi:hypothetical protein BDQ17DRAFT_1373575 [Cyathus striatus]|nr:hypothetical protein BDQ17DRAFT_1373575 [Cyathus striatus]